MERRRLTKGLRANKPTEEVEERGTKGVEMCVPGDKLAGGAEPRNEQSRKNLKLSWRGSVEKQAQHGPDRMNKLRAESDEDQSARPDRRGAGRPLRPIFLEGILLGVSVSSSFMSIEVLVSTSVSPFKDLYKKCSLAHLYGETTEYYFEFEFRVFCSLCLSRVLCVLGEFPLNLRLPSVVILL